MPRRSAAVLVALVAACYRDPAPVANVGLRPRSLASAGCSMIDDLPHPPLDPNPGGRLRNHTSGSLAGPTVRQPRVLDLDLPLAASLRHHVVDLDGVGAELGLDALGRARLAGRLAVDEH